LAATNAQLQADIARRKQAEETLRQNEERLDLAFRAAQDGVWDWNMETGAVFYSSRYKQMLGYDEDEFEPHVSTWERLLHPDDKVRVREVVDAVLRGEREYEMGFRLRHKDGHYIDILSRGFPVRRERGGYSIPQSCGYFQTLLARNSNRLIATMATQQSQPERNTVRHQQQGYDHKQEVGDDAGPVLSRVGDDPGILR
jgi:PAS domain S-box-containing protein